MSNKQTYLNQLFNQVTKGVIASDRQRNEISDNIRSIIREEAQKIIPNIAEKESRSFVGTIHDPETGWTHEAIHSGGMSASNSFGTPIMNADGYMAIMYPDKRNPEAVAFSKKVMGQDKDWTEDFYSPEYLKHYQEQKSKQIRLMLSDEVNNPMKAALQSGLPVGVITRSNPFAAALIDSRDFITLQVNNNLVDTLGLALLQYNLVDAFERVSAPNLVAKYWSFGDVDVEVNVPEGDIIETTKTEMEEIKVKIGKNVGGVGATWESQLMVTQGDPFGKITSKIASKLAQKRNEQMATIIETATTTAGADMGAMTGDRSTNDPTDFIQPVLNTIQNDQSQYAFDNQVGTVFISGSKAFQKFNTNSFTKGIFAANGTIILDNQTASGIPTIPTNATWRTSSLVSATKLWIADRRTFPAIFGPSQRSEHFDNRNLSRATYYFDAFGTTKVNDNAAREITGVVT
jgi:hypothetical protein